MANNTGIKYGFTDLLEDNVGRLQELLDKVAQKNPQKALELLLKLSEFALPKLRAIEVNNQPEYGTLNVSFLAVELYLIPNSHIRR